MLPIVTNHKEMTCYNVSCLFPEKIPEDDIGLLVYAKDLLELELEDLGVPEYIEYLSHKRMCPHCGVVSDHSKTKKQPWNYVK